MMHRHQRGLALSSHLKGSASRNVMALAAMVAAPMLALSASPAHGQSICAETAPGSGVFNCSGTSSDTQALDGVGVPADVSLDDTVTVDTTASGGSGGNAFFVTGDGGAVFTQAAHGGDLTGAISGVDVRNDGAGALSVIVAGAATGMDRYGIYARNTINGTDLSIAAVDTSGGEVGIRADNFGTGSLTITSSGTATGTAFIGIYGINGSTGADLSIAAADTSGNQDGIRASNRGSGSLAITSAGTATGTDGAGILANNRSASTDLSIFAVDTSGGRYGIRAVNDGAGSLAITSTGGAAGTTYDGIDATNGDTGTDLSITAVDSAGGKDGIRADNRGTGSLAITSTGTVTGALIGIYGVNRTAGTDFSIAAADTSGGQQGIRAINRGSGALTITSTGTVSGTDESAIIAYNGSAGTDISIAAVDSTGGEFGIRADNFGSGALTITSTGTVSGTTYSGIDAANRGVGTDLSITAVDSAGGEYGIVADNRGSGSLIIGSSGAATGTANDGIHAYNSSAGTDLSITAADASGGEYGIYAHNEGAGSLAITSTGTATGTAYDGIHARSGSAGTGLSIVAADTNGGENGIRARNEGAGALTIISTGAAVGASAIGTGISAYNGHVGGDLSIAAADTSGGSYGIRARNFGTGSFTITSTGTATGTAYDGIYARNAGAGADLSITAADTSGGENGIRARNEGAGSLAITSTSTATGMTVDGIYAYNSSAGVDLLVAAADTKGREYGIHAHNDGVGSLTITSTGMAAATNFHGIYAYNGSAGTDLSIDAADTSGGENGIFAGNLGSGALAITSTGAAAGTSQFGILAFNSAAGTDLSIAAADASGGMDGIHASNLGSGALVVTTTDTVTGTSRSGIYAATAGADLIIDAEGDVTGGIDAIHAHNQGSGTLAITSAATAAGVNRDGIFAINEGAGAGLSIAAADSSGGESGIAAGNYGSGALTITSTGTAAGAAHYGIYARNNTAGTDLSIAAADSSGGEDGIYAHNEGSGSLTINSTGTATGTSRRGIYAYNGGTSADLSITAAGVSGGLDGILAGNLGTGALAITSTGTVTGTNRAGIFAANGPAATSLSITAADVSGGLDGIHASNLGSGALAVTTTGAVTGTTRTGIYVANAGTDLTIDAEGDVSGGAHAIHADNRGSGSLAITSAGTAAGEDGDGIYALNGAAGTGLSIAAADTSGSESGISALNHGRGSLAITSTGTARSGRLHGISAYNSSAGADLSIVAVDTSGGGSGIFAGNQGTGALTITSTGAATGANGAGIFAVNGGTATDLSVVAVDTSGSDYGIRAGNLGTGAVTITSTGAAVGTNQVGILANNTSAGTDLSIAAADASGGEYGIHAYNEGAGLLTITSTGTAIGTAHDGIYARSGSAGTDLSIAAVDTNGGESGIHARNDGSGSLAITSTGAAIGTNGVGIYAYNSGIAAVDLSIAAADTSGGEDGILADNQGTGSLTIVSTGVATGGNRDGISAFNRSSGTDLSITAADASGGGNGISALNRGTGSLTVTATGAAAGTSVAGIYARNDGAGTDVSITAADASGGEYGILARNKGIGSLTVISTGAATGTSGAGILATNGSTGTDLSISAADTSGGETGILADNRGTGSLTIMSSGTAAGAADYGIYANNSGTDLTIDAQGDVTGVVEGIHADNEGSGALAITSTGATTGTNRFGIYAYNGGTGTNLSISAADTSGGKDGILAGNFGTSSLVITSTGTAAGADWNGINAHNGSAGTDLSIAAVDTSGGGRYGIYARNDGSGALAVTSTGTATGMTGAGIYARSGNAGTGLSIAAVDTGSGKDGIHARNDGGGALAITSTGAAIGTSQFGIYAYNSSATAADLSIDAADTSGGEDGILAGNQGTGALAITSTGVATGANRDGISASNGGNGTDLSITAADTSGGQYGISAVNHGSGSLTIKSTGAATGTNRSGISAFNSDTGTDLSIAAADAGGGQYGISAVNGGTGSLAITSTGTAQGAAVAGIYARNSSTAADLSIAAADVSGGRYGIYTDNSGADLTIDAKGDVTGGVDAIHAANAGSGTVTIKTSAAVNGGEDAIDTRSAAGAIVIDNSGTLNAGTGYAVTTSGGPTTLTNIGTVNGRVMFGGMDDTIVNSGLFNATASSDFGAGADLFTNTGTVRVDGVVAFAGLERFANHALVTMIDGATNDSLVLAGAYEAQSDLAIDVSLDGAGSADTLVVGGAATGHSSIIVNDISTSADFGHAILLVDAGAGTAADAFSLDLSFTASGFLTYGLSFDASANDFFLGSTIGTPVFQTLKVAEGAQSLWYRSADAVAAQMRSRRSASGSPLWLQIYGTNANRDERRDFTSAGFTQSIGLDYGQDYFGFQMGYDFGPGAAGDGVNFGVTGGYLNSTLGFDGTADRAGYDGFNIGAYAGIKARRFFADALLKYDFIDASIVAPTPGYTAKLDGKAYGARLQAGYRCGGERFFAEPVVSIEYQSTSLDDFSALGATIDYDRFDGLRGMAGLRFGGRSEIGGRNTMTYYLGGRAVHEFGEDDGLVFSSGTSSIAIANTPQDTFGRFELGMNIATQGGVTGFIESNADIGSGYSSYGGRAGLRLRF